jgi:hypothetical protein
MQLATRPWITGGVALVSFETALFAEAARGGPFVHCPEVTLSNA